MVNDGIEEPIELGKTWYQRGLHLMGNYKVVLNGK